MRTVIVQAFMSSASCCKFLPFTGCDDISLIHRLVKKKSPFVCRGHGMFTFLFNNKFLSEWIGEAWFLCWYFIQPCVSVKESFLYHPRKFMAYEFRRPGFRFQLGHTPGYVSPGRSLWQFSLYFFHLWIKDKRSVSFVNPLWNEAALV